MIKKIKLIAAGLMATALFAVPVLAPAAVFAADASVQNGLCQGANLQVGSSCQDINAQQTQDTVNSTIAWVINVFSIVVGVAAVIMIIIGGMRYVISGGDSGNVSSAKSTILYAVIGLVIVALAQFVVKFVLTKLGGTQ